MVGAAILLEWRALFLRLGYLLLVLLFSLLGLEMLERWAIQWPGLFAVRVVIFDTLFNI